MLLMHYEETIWCANLGGVLDTPPAHGLFAGRQLNGSKWLQQLPAEDRAVWASLGRRALAERGINWHSLGGRARQRSALRDKRGRFLPDWGPF